MSVLPPGITFNKPEDWERKMNEIASEIDVPDEVKI